MLAPVVRMTGPRWAKELALDLEDSKKGSQDASGDHERLLKHATMVKRKQMRSHPPAHIAELFRMRFAPTTDNERKPNRI